MYAKTWEKGTENIVDGIAFFKNIKSGHVENVGFKGFRWDCRVLPAFHRKLIMIGISRPNSRRTLSFALEQVSRQIRVFRILELLERDCIPTLQR